MYKFVLYTVFLYIVILLKCIKKFIMSKKKTTIKERAGNRAKKVREFTESKYQQVYLLSFVHSFLRAVCGLFAIPIFHELLNKTFLADLGPIFLWTVSVLISLSFEILYKSFCTNSIREKYALLKQDNLIPLRLWVVSIIMVGISSVLGFYGLKLYAPEIASNQTAIVSESKTQYNKVFKEGSNELKKAEKKALDYWNTNKYSGKIANTKAKNTYAKLQDQVIFIQNRMNKKLDKIAEKKDFEITKDLSKSQQIGKISSWASLIVELFAILVILLEYDISYSMKEEPTPYPINEEVQDNLPQTGPKFEYNPLPVEAGFKMSEGICKVCKGSFPYKSNKVFCSSACKNTYHNKLK